MKSLLVFVLFCLVLVYAQQPAKPVWPTRFSASIVVEHWQPVGDIEFGRWFYDTQQNKDRLDGPTRFLDENYYSTRIYDHTKKTETSVYYQEATEVCFIRPFNHSLPRPPFRRIEYVGKAIVNFNAAYHWFERSEDNRFTFQYYDSQDNRKPLRIDFDDRQYGASTWYFFEFDEARQNPEIFTLPKLILDTCNK